MAQHFELEINNSKKSSEAINSSRTMTKASGNETNRKCL